MFASTPPLEALRLLLSEAATVEKRGSGEKVVMVADVSRAFFEAPARRRICVELPAEALTADEQKEDLVGLLNMSLYGTRDAAANFQHEVRIFMSGLHFSQARFNPSLYYNPTRDLKVLVHGDDFVSVGTRENIQWFKEKLAARFEVKTKVVGDHVASQTSVKQPG